MSDLPQIIEYVWLCAPDGAAYECRVLGRRAGNVALLPPEEPGLVDGDTYELVWQTSDDLCRQSVRLELTGDPEAPMVLTPESDVLRADRRENVRIPVESTVIVAPRDRSLPHIGRALDLSEGGIRVALSNDQLARFAPGQQVRVVFTLRGSEYDVEGSLLRVEKPWTGDMGEIVVGFHVPPVITGRLRRAILVEQVLI